MSEGSIERRKFWYYKRQRRQHVVDMRDYHKRVAEEKLPERVAVELGEDGRTVKSIHPGGRLEVTLSGLAGVYSVRWGLSRVDDRCAIGDYALTQSGAIGQTVAFDVGEAGTSGELVASVNNGESQRFVKWWVARSKPRIIPPCVGPKLVFMGVFWV